MDNKRSRGGVCCDGELGVSSSSVVALVVVVVVLSLLFVSSFFIFFLDDAGRIMQGLANCCSRMVKPWTVNCWPGAKWAVNKSPCTWEVTCHVPSKGYVNWICRKLESVSGSFVVVVVIDVRLDCCVFHVRRRFLRMTPCRTKRQSGTNDKMT